MNKASFLSLVRQASHISDQDVEELEKLVVNFPYCQTAHLLIAKAAYDKGSMLSNQKLKKAAIYAANRQLLKKLIHTSDATVALQPVSGTDEETKLPEEVKNRVAETVAKAAEKVEIPTLAAAPEITSEEIGTAAEVSDQNLIEVTDNNETAIAEFIAESEIQETVELETTIEENPEVTAQADIIETESLAISESGILEIVTSEVYEDEIIAEEILTASAGLSEGIAETEIAEPTITEEIIQPDSDLGTEEQIAQPEPTFISVAEEPISEPEETSEIVEETVAETPEKVGEFTTEAAETLEDVIDVHELLLEDAPEILKEEISQPETAEEAGEGEEIKAEAETQKPARQDDLLHETLANFDQYLFRPEKETEEPEAEPDLKVVYAEDEIQSIFNRDSIGYWMSSSRLGESLELKNELTAKTPINFHPELILEYAKTHELHKEIKPVSSNLSKQLEIIDEFLKMTPRLKAMANSKIKPEPQEDLSFKSSKISKNLATESYANILVQQGKIKKAIKIYEHLILKFPEKKPYFVAQIEKLQNQE
jgi:hypothetical protein